MRAYSMDLRERVLHDSDAGMQAAAVASKYRVSASWVRRLKQRRRETGEVAPRQQRYGRHPVLASQLHTLAALIREQPDRTLADLQVALGTSASLATIWRAVKQLGFTVKKTVRASEHDRPDVAAARAQWATTAPTLDPTRLVWVANYYSARNPLRLSSLVILGVVARMFRCATRSSCWCTCIATLARLMGPGGLRSVVAESVLVKQQLLMLNRSRHRPPNLCASDRILAGVCALFMRPARVIRSAIVLRPSTILEFHRALRTRKYRWLFSPTRRRTGPQGPSNALVDAIVDMKRRNPRWGCPRIAQQIALAFAVDIDKDVVRRALATHYRPAPRSGGPSWLTFLGHAKDSRWSIDLFRCESATLRSHWVLVVMDHYTRRIVGFGIHAGTVDGRALCRMFNHAIRGLSRPKRLSSDNDPLYRFHPWCANLRVLQVTEVKSVPYVPLSHPFVERLIGTLRRECVDQLLFWSASDLADKLVAFQDFYNAHRAHASLDGRTPVPIRKDVARLDRYRWDAHCRGLYQTPIAA